MSREETVSIECDNTGLGTGPSDHELDPEDVPDGSELVEAPLHWLSIMAVRVVPNPKARASNDLPPPPAEMTESAMQAWLLEVSEASTQDAEPPFITQSLLLHLSPAEACKLALAIPDCFENQDDFVDLALMVANGGAQ